MRQSVGFTFLFNFFTTFLVVLIFVLISIMNYMKAYKVNSKIVAIIEKNEGYNLQAKNEIDAVLTSLGYRSTTPTTCASKSSSGYTNISSGLQNYDICLYTSKARLNQGDTFKMGILTYIYFDIPIIGSLVKIPVYTTTDNIYVFRSDMR